MTSKGSSAFSRSAVGPFLKFAVVGAIGVVVNEGLLIVIQDMGVYFLYAGAIAIEVSILTNFVLNDLWTFKERRSGSGLGRLAKFNALMLGGLVVNLVVLDAGTVYLGMSSSVANLLGIAAAFVLRYYLSVKYAWMKYDGGEVETPAPGASVSA